MNTFKSKFKLKNFVVKSFSITREPGKQGTADLVLKPSGYFLTNAPALIFPYVRSYISAVTALSGLSAINLPVMNLSSLKPLLQANISVVDE